MIPGALTDQSVYHSELGGIYAITVMTKTICNIFGIVEGRITVMCDGLSALNQASSPNASIQPNSKHFDMIGVIKAW